jgi:hypothetical protein
MTKATKALASLFRLLEKYHYAINKPIYCPLKTKKKKLYFQRPSVIEDIRSHLTYSPFEPIPNMRTTRSQTKQK